MHGHRVAAMEAAKHSDQNGEAQLPLNIAICGLGRAAMGLLNKELYAVPQVRIVGAFDLLPERIKAMADRVSCRIYHSFEELLGDPNVDLVVIATRSIDHVPMGKQALAAGKHVLVEKPMGIDLRGADELLNAAANSEGRLFIRQNRRYEPALLQAQEIIASGKLGEVFQCSLRVHKFQFRNDWQTIRKYGGGQLLNWGPHVIDWGLQLLESPLADLWSDLKRIVTAGDAEDTVKLILRGTNGRVIDIEMSDAVALAQPGFIIYGSRGTLVINDTSCTIKYLDPTSQIDVSADASTQSATGGYAGPAKLIWIEETFPLAPKNKSKLFHSIYATLKKGEACPVANEQARENMRVIEEARKGTPFQN
ncbi:MAG: Gfo/Idh/MocA family oxidoreductase [Phycisphaerae bacterium]|nr:Gfo/Idh/MocA family oxidoreductase [Phycisphaerae bacterium]